MAFIPRPHEIYKHFKGNLYQVVAVAEHTETGEQLVIYQALYDEFKIYARPLDMFLDKVDGEKYPDADQEYRFELQNGSEGRQRERGKAGFTPDAAAADGDAEELNLDPMVVEFLDADTYEQRLNILAGLHHRITDDMITIMAVACDIEVPDGMTEERYASLKSCLQTMERYECNRLR